MGSKTASGIMVTLLLASMLTLTLNVQSVEAEPETWIVDDDGPADFSTIQGGIDSPLVVDGDTIFVKTGTYYEDVVVYKSLSIRGENPISTIIDARGSGLEAIKIVANNVVIENFAMLANFPAHYALELESVSNCTIRNNKIGDVSVYSRGMRLEYSSNINIYENNISRIDGHCCYLYSCSNINICGNYISDWGQEGGTGGITLSSCSEVVVAGNNLTGCFCGWGVYLEHSSGNTVFGNNMTDNWVFGVALLDSSGNVFYHNNFVDNDWAHVFDVAEWYPGYPRSICVWDDGYPSGGNYWDDYADVDQYSGPEQDELGSDGIWDHPYVIDANNQDNYPFVESWSPEPPPEPDFEISVLPQPEVVVHVGGWNDSTSLLVKSVKGFEGLITLSFESPSGLISVEFAADSVYLYKDSEVNVEMNVSCLWAPLSTYVGLIKASSDSIKHELDFEIIVVGNSEAIQNIVRIEEINAELNLFELRFRWFSIQQNFHIYAPNGTCIYWAQNIVDGAIRGIGVKHVWIRSIFQVFPRNPQTDEPVLSIARGVRIVSEPFVLNLTSHIEGNLLFLENNASPPGGAFASLVVPEGSYIVAFPRWSAPQICLVGTSARARITSTIAVFEYPTAGQIECYSKLLGEDTWRSTENRVFGIGESQTVEQSRNLTWWSDGAFLWNDQTTDQGISFTPNYETPP